MIVSDNESAFVEFGKQLPSPSVVVKVSTVDFIIRIAALKQNLLESFIVNDQLTAKQAEQGIDPSSPYVDLMFHTSASVDVLIEGLNMIKEVLVKREEIVASVI